MKSFSFVHAADLHLGSPFTGLAECSPDWAQRLAKASFQAFERIIRLCLDRQVDFLILAGDIYDSAEQNLRAQVCVRDGLAQLAEASIATYIATGNHDYKVSGDQLRWPERVHFFPPGQVATYPVIKDGQLIVEISGVSYPNQNPDQSFLPLFPRSGEAPFRIGVLHTNLGNVAGYANYAPCTLTDLLHSGFDYWALGHVHQAAIVHAGHPTVIYPGTSQGRSARETGPKGCYYVQVDRSGVRPSFISTAEVLWAELGLDISPWSDLDELFTAVDDELADYPQQADYLIVRLCLSGRGPVHHELYRPGAVEELTDALRARTYPGWRGVWFDRVKVQTGPPVAKDVERESGTLAADFLEIIDALVADLKAGGNSPLVQELLAEISPLFGKNRRYLGKCSPELLLQAALAAEELGLDLLTRGEE
ncbi:MAG: DNA repair exonuclease [Firmicutes bacterium]|nr:DNA repair exonuclease [Bacillota bacterium]